MHDWMPALRPVTILGDDGAPIPFGERWGMDHPPHEAYSRVTHPERYAQLHEVADALLAHLVSSYDCEAVEEPPRGDQGVRELRAVRVESVPGTAPIRLAWTDFPGVQVEIGSAFATWAPVCGCDACDEGLDSLVDALVDETIAAVEGGLQESFDASRRTEGSSLVTRSGGRSGTSRSTRSRDELRALAARTPDRWAPWPER